MKLNKIFDHTLLKPDAEPRQIVQLCREAKALDFYAVCVGSSFVETAAEELAGCDVKIAAVAGFPLGTCTTETKRVEAEQACRCGASEIDMVLHIGMLRSGDYDYVFRDIQEVVCTAEKYGAIVKVILETGLLSDDEIVKGCRIAEDAGARFVKTSTGFLAPGADVHAVKLMKETVGDLVKVKAAGGIRDLETCLALVEAGAERIGSSSSVAITEAYKASLEK